MPRKKMRDGGLVANNSHACTRHLLSSGWTTRTCFRSQNQAGSHDPSTRLSNAFRRVRQSQRETSGISPILEPEGVRSFPADLLAKVLGHLSRVLKRPLCLSSLALSQIVTGEVIATGQAITILRDLRKHET